MFVLLSSVQRGGNCFQSSHCHLFSSMTVIKYRSHCIHKPELRLWSGDRLGGGFPFYSDPHVGLLYWETGAAKILIFLEQLKQSKFSKLRSEFLLPV